MTLQYLLFLFGLYFSVLDDSLTKGGGGGGGTHNNTIFSFYFLLMFSLFMLLCLCSALANTLILNNILQGFFT